MRGVPDVAERCETMMTMCSTVENRSSGLFNHLTANTFTLRLTLLHRWSIVLAASAANPAADTLAWRRFNVFYALAISAAFITTKWC